MMEGRIIETDRQRGRKQRDERNEEGAGVMEMDGGDRGGWLIVEVFSDHLWRLRKQPWHVYAPSCHP